MQTMTSNLSPNAARWIRISAIITMLVVALSSAVLSFDGLQKLALASHIPAHLAFLFPIAVDMTILMGSLAVLLYEMFGLKAKFGWFTVLFGTGLSVTGNVISVSDAGLIAQVLHGIIPILLCISLESLLRILRFNIRRSTADVQPSIEERVEQVDPLENIESPEPSPSSSQAEIESTPTGDSTAQSKALTSVALDGASSINNPGANGDTTFESRRQRRECEDELVPSHSVMASEFTDPSPEIVHPVNQSHSFVDRSESVPSSSTVTANFPPSGKVDEQIPDLATGTSLVADSQVDETAAPVLVEKTTTAHNASVSKLAKDEKKSPPKKRVATIIPPLEDYEREDFKTLIDSLPKDTPAVHKLGSVFKVKDPIAAADIRWLLDYEEGKRVDSLVRRAREWAAAN